MGFIRASGCSRPEWVAPIRAFLPAELPPRGCERDPIWRERLSGDGAPGGHPLIRRFSGSQHALSDSVRPVGTILRWRTLCLVNSGRRPEPMRWLSRCPVASFRPAGRRIIHRGGAETVTTGLQEIVGPGPAPLGWSERSVTPFLPQFWPALGWAASGHPDHLLAVLACCKSGHRCGPSASGLTPRSVGAQSMSRQETCDETCKEENQEGAQHEARPVGHVYRQGSVSTLAPQEIDQHDHEPNCARQ